MRAQERYDRAAACVREAERLIIAAGAGMGVDSGLPDFRGEGGLYGMSSMVLELGVDVYRLASARTMHEDPVFAWGGLAMIHRLFTSAAPHVGYHILRRWAETRPHFIYTSNVDDLFERAGFDADRVVDCHGSVLWMQANLPETTDDPIWRTGALDLEVDPTTLCVVGGEDALPRTPDGALARLNVLMFDDVNWLGHRVFAQERRYEAWRDEAPDARVVIVECGAGDQLPAVRGHSAQLLRAHPNATVLRINPEPCPEQERVIHLQGGAREVLERLDRMVE